MRAGTKWSGTEFVLQTAGERREALRRQEKLFSADIPSCERVSNFWSCLKPLFLCLRTASCPFPTEPVCGWQSSVGLICQLWHSHASLLTAFAEKAVSEQL